MKVDSRKTLEIIEELLEQYTIYIDRCNNYIYRKEWSDTTNEVIEEGIQLEANFQASIIESRDKTIQILAQHKNLIDNYKKNVLSGYNYIEDVYLQEQYIQQYQAHLKRLKEHLKNVKWDEENLPDGTPSLYQEDAFRYKEGLFQAKAIGKVENMILNLETSLGINPNEKVVLKRGGSKLNPFTESVLLSKNGIQALDIPRNVAYKDWLINQEEPPVENKQKYIDFWKKHCSYAITGITTGGVHIPGILYFQLNFMKLSVMTRDSNGNTITEVINPMLRDNEYYINYNYAICEQKRQFFFGVGCRRFSKSAFMTAVFAREAMLFKNSISSYNSLSSKELQDMEADFNVFMEHRPSCFEDIEKIGSFGSTGTKVQFAIQLSENSKKTSYSEIRYLNLSNATSKSDNNKSQKGAGGKISRFALEEAGKGNYSKVLTVIKPALSTIEGDLSTAGIVMATGGDTNLSKDLEGDFLNAGERGYFVGRHKEYAEHVNGFNFVQESNREVGFFVPDVMSMYAGAKKKILFKDYINKKWTKKELEEIEGMYIYVTDWENAKEKCRELIALEYKDSEEKGDMTRMYLPSQPEDCFVYKNKNPFNIPLAKQREQFLIDNNLWGRCVELTQSPSRDIIIHPTDKKPYDKFPTERGKNYDAPIQIYEDPVMKNPPMWTYIAGFDGYRIEGETTTSNSFGSLFILKCINYEFKIVAEYTSRPTNTNHFLEQCRLLLELYNAMCLGEREDLARFQSHLELKKSIRLLSREISLDKGVESSYRLQGNKPYGQSAANRNNKEYLRTLLITSMNEQNQVFDENGEVVDVMTGIELVNSIMLLKELIHFSKGNYDRIWSYAHALLLADWLVRMNIKPGNFSNTDEYQNFKKVVLPRMNSTKILNNSVIPRRR